MSKPIISIQLDGPTGARMYYGPETSDMQRIGALETRKALVKGFRERGMYTGATVMLVSCTGRFIATLEV